MEREREGDSDQWSSYLDIGKPKTSLGVKLIV